MYRALADNGNKAKYKGKVITDEFLERQLGNPTGKTKGFSTIKQARAYAYKKVNLFKDAGIPCEINSGYSTDSFVAVTLHGWVFRDKGHVCYESESTGSIKILKADGSLGKKIGDGGWWTED